MAKLKYWRYDFFFFLNAYIYIYTSKCDYVHFSVWRGCDDSPSVNKQQIACHFVDPIKSGRNETVSRNFCICSAIRHERAAPAGQYRDALATSSGRLCRGRRAKPHLFLSVSGFQHVTVILSAGRGPRLLWFTATWKAAGHSCASLTLLYQEINELLPKLRAGFSCFFFLYLPPGSWAVGGGWPVSCVKKGNCSHWSVATLWSQIGNWISMRSTEKSVYICEVPLQSIHSSINSSIH